MDFFKSQLARLQQQFNQLTASQKMLSMALVAIMGMTLVWWGHYAGTAEMEPLLDQELAAEEFSRITGSLHAHGIPFTPNGSRILVSADRRLEAIAELGSEQLLPKDISSAFMEIVGKMDNPMNSPDRSEAIRNEARQATLAAILRYFPKVQNAMVVIADAQKRSFNNPVSARATIYLKMKSGAKADNKLVNAAADVVSGAVSGLQRSDVRVIVDGVSRLFASEEGSDSTAGGMTYLDRVREAESYYAGIVINQLSFCDGVMVHVSVTPKDESSQVEIEQFDTKTGVFKESETELETSNTTTSANRPSGDPGVVPNTGVNQGMSISANAGSDGQVATTERNKVKMDNRPGHTVTKRKNPAGAVTIVSASVTFPRSFFVKAYKSLKGDKEPGDAVLAPFITSELDRWRKVVKASLNIATDEALVVDSYVDLLPAAIEAPVQTTAVSLLLGSHGKEIALGVLALASLFMVSMMVRKSGPAVGLAGLSLAAAGGIPTSGTTVDAMLAKATARFKSATEETAEVGEGHQTLDGIELDDESIRAQQVVEQVSTMVKEDPDAAANLIKRWIVRT